MARRRGGRYDNPRIFKTDMFRRVYSTPPTPFYDEDVLLGALRVWRRSASAQF
jgi:hypothetical protein